MCSSIALNTFVAAPWLWVPCGFVDRLPKERSPQVEEEPLRICVIK